MLFLVNPKRKGGRMAGRKRATPAQRRALKKARAAKAAKARRRSTAGRKAAATRRRKTSARRTTKRRRNPSTPKRRKTPVAARRRRRSPARRNRARRAPTGFKRVRRQTFKRSMRNPAWTLKNMGKILQQGVIDASGVVLGKAGARIVSGFIPIGGEGMMNIAKQAIAAIGVGFIGGQFMPRDYSRFLIAGALAAPVETFLTGIPVIGPALTGEGELGEYLGFGEAPGLPIGEAPGLPIGEYVQPGMGEYVEQYP